MAKLTLKYQIDFPEISTGNWVNIPHSPTLLWSANWGLYTEYRVAYSPVLTRLESDNKKYLPAKESKESKES